MAIGLTTKSTLPKGYEFTPLNQKDNPWEKNNELPEMSDADFLKCVEESPFLSDLLGVSLIIKGGKLTIEPGGIANGIAK